MLKHFLEEVAGFILLTGFKKFNHFEAKMSLMDLFKGMGNGSESCDKSERETTPVLLSNKKKSTLNSIQAHSELPGE